MNIDEQVKLKSIFYEILKIDGRNEFEKLEVLTENIINILKKTELDTWKKLEIIIERYKLTGIASAYISVLNILAELFDIELKIEY